MEPTTARQAQPIPSSLRDTLRPVARKVFWWGEPDDWLDNRVRFVAQVMTYGDLNDINITRQLLGDSAFLAVLDHAPPGVLDEKSWVFWHRRYHREVPPLPQRRLDPSI
jgi:hypothetical protein